MAQLAAPPSHKDMFFDDADEVKPRSSPPRPFWVASPSTAPLSFFEPAVKRARLGEEVAPDHLPCEGQAEDAVRRARAQRQDDEALARALGDELEQRRRQERIRSKRRRARQRASTRKASLRQARLDEEVRLRRAEFEREIGKMLESAVVESNNLKSWSQAEQERDEAELEQVRREKTVDTDGCAEKLLQCEKELELVRSAAEAMSIQHESYREEIERLRFTGEKGEEELEKLRLEVETKRKELAMLRVEREINRRELERLRLEGENNRKELEELRMEQQEHREELETLRLEAARNRDELERLRMQRQCPSPEAACGLAWEFQANDGVWTPYTSDAGDAITQSYMRGEKACTFVHGGCRYEISLQENAMVQRNCSTGRCRKIRYTVGVPEHWSISAVQNQLKQWGASIGMEGGLGCQGRLAIETVLKPITQKEALEEFSNLLRDSVFHHHKWEDPTSECDKVKKMFAICEAYHVENFLLYQGYRNHCRHLQNKHLQTGVRPKRIWPDVDWPLWGAGEKVGIADTALNERLLFHGTSFDTAKEIALGGFDSRLAKERGMYGQGTYFAAQSCKSHQYTKTGPLHTVLLARVALGDPHYTWRCDKTIRRPPKRDNHEGSPLCDSLIAAPGWMEGHKQGWQSHVEFVIFEQMQAYPEYVLRYRLAPA